jgi:catalase-peroxidase
MGPVARYLGPEVPSEILIWQDPVPAATGEVINAADIADLKTALLGSGLSVGQLVRTAWASAATFRGTDKRGGANGARIRLEPQRDWAANDPAELAQILAKIEAVQTTFNAAGGRQVSLADLIVLGGCAAIEKAASDAGTSVQVPFTPGRTDATAEMTDVASFAVLEPTFDGFRNYLAKGQPASAEAMLVERATLLTLTAPEMTALVGGLRVLGANAGGSTDGVLTARPGVLTNDFFVNLLDMGTEWKSTNDTEDSFEGRDRDTGEVRWTGSRADLVFGSNSVLRALAEVYGSSDGSAKFTSDFVAAWNKVMMLDRFDLG